MRWEYKFTVIEWRDPAIVTSLLNDYGDKGWEAVSILPSPGDQNGRVVFLKRLKHPES